MDIISNLDDGLQGPDGTLEDSLQNELELILREQRNQHFIERERDLNIYRSGSAPPTVEGSLSAVGGLFRNPDFREFNGSISAKNGGLSEDEIRLHPAYLSYYYSHETINPRLPPPLVSKEDWRVAQRFQVGGSSFGGTGSWRKKLVNDDDNSSLFSMQPRLSVQQAENDLMELRNASGRNLSRQTSSQWLDRGPNDLIGLSSSGLGARRKSFADIVQVIDNSFIFIFLSFGFIFSHEHCFLRKNKDYEHCLQSALACLIKAICLHRASVAIAK